MLWSDPMIKTVSFDFDGVLSTLVLGRTWEKTRAKKGSVPIFTPAVRGLKHGLAALTEGFRKPLPGAEDALRELRASGLTLFLLTSRTGERIAAAERWLERRGWSDVFGRKFYNEEGQDADRFKTGIIRTQPIDAHIDDDPETIACLSRRFPDKLFIRMDHYRRKGPQAGNIFTVSAWDEVPAFLAINS
jgi:phosphoglycolate phosphatase-like HAD superfamily hydrolase